MKKLTSIILSLILHLSLSATALAADVTTAGGTGQTPVTLTAAATRFSVTVPTSLPISVDEDGNVTTATTAKIVNNGYGSVKVTGMTVTAGTGWTIAAYDTDMLSEKVGAKKVGLYVNGDYTKSDGTITFTSSKYPALSGANAAATDELAITYDAAVPAQASALSGMTVATVVFTIGWNS
jgi:hypothetical protein